MSAIHILFTPSIARPWWRTDERFGLPSGEKVWTDCCACKVPAEETVSRVVASWEPPLGGMGCYQEPPLPWERTPSAEGCGCNANPRKRWGKALREMQRFA